MVFYFYGLDEKLYSYKTLANTIVVSARLGSGTWTCGEKYFSVTYDAVEEKKTFFLYFPYTVGWCC